MRTGFDKNSVLAEHSLGPAGEAFTRGWERGHDPPATVDGPKVIGPATPAAPPESPDSLEVWVAGLRRAVVAHCWRPENEVGVLTSTAVTTETVTRDVERFVTRRRVSFVRVALGPDPNFPRWTRTAPASAPGAPLQDGWLDALARETSGWRPGLTVEVPDFRRAADDIVLDVFAFADILRAAAAGWRRTGAPAGSVVAAPAVAIDDPGFAFPPNGVDRDAEGEPVRPLAVVRDGRLWGPPRRVVDERQGRGRATGAAVRLTWRRPAATGWRRFVIRASGQPSTLPDDCLVVTRVIPLPGGALFAGGHRRRGGEVVSRWGLSRLAPAGWWLLHVRGFVGPPVADGAGLPVETPAAVVTPSRV